MSQVTSTRSSSSPVVDIVDRFRKTNAIYRNRAIDFRNSLRLTAHARTRAANLHLQVDTGRAARCDQRQVSVIPLPILDTEPSPLQFVFEDGKSVEQTMPHSVGSSPSSDTSSSDMSESDGEQGAMNDEELAAIDMNEMISRAPGLREGNAMTMASPIARPSHRPALRCVIPTISLNAPVLASTEYSPRSKFSPDTALEATEEWSSVTLTSAVSESVGAKGAKVFEEDDKLYITIPAKDRSPVDMPIEAHRMSWGCGEVEAPVSAGNPTSATSASSSGSTSSGPSTAGYSTSSASDSGLHTPDDTHEPPLIIRIKRSNTSIRSEGAEETHIEKRQRFDTTEVVRQVHPKRPRSLGLVPTGCAPSGRSVSTPVGRR